LIYSSLLVICKGIWRVSIADAIRNLLRIADEPSVISVRFAREPGYRENLRAR
jgi:hypothetical protein